MQRQLEGFVDTFLFTRTNQSSSSSPPFSLSLFHGKHTFAIATDGLERDAMRCATLMASSTVWSFGTTREMSPALSASLAVMGTPVRIISMAFDLPTALTSLCVPPAPGIVPNLQNGF